GIIAPVIPPSIGLIIFGVSANVSISKLFMAGIFPGLMMGIALCATWALVVRRDKVTPQPRKNLKDIVKAAREAIWALGMPVIIIVGLRMGVFTPTEAAVVAAVYAWFVSTFIYRELSLRALYQVFVNSAKVSAVIMLLVAAAMVSAWLITVAGLPDRMVDLLDPLIGEPMLLMIAAMLLVVLVGTAMDMTPTILILTPVMMPAIEAAGIDPVYFGIMFIINCAIGLITPPVGTVLNTVAGVGRLSMDDVTRGALPFLLAQLVLLFLFVLFPSLVLVPAHWF